MHYAAVYNIIIIVFGSLRISSRRYMNPIPGDFNERREVSALEQYNIIACYNNRGPSSSSR